MNEKLRQLLRKAQGFEAKSERLAKLDPDQLNLALEDIEQMIAKAEAIEEKTQAAAAPRKRRINRGALPAHLSRIHETAHRPGRDLEPLGSLFPDHVHRLLAAGAVRIGRRHRRSIKQKPKGC